MANRGTIRQQVLNLTASNSMISSANVNDILDAEHTEILESYSWTRRKADTRVNTAATYSTGTVAGTAASAVVTGTSTAWTSALTVGRHMRIGSNTFFHRISSFQSATQVTLESALPATVAAGAAYTIFQHLYDLPSDFGRPTNVTSDVRMGEWSRSDIDRLDPYRSSTASRPEVYSIRGITGTSDVFEVEFWPVPSAAITIRIEYLRTNTLSADTDSPLYRSDVLVWKSGESAAFFLHGKTGDAAWLALADRYHARYTESLQGAREDDLGRYSALMHIRDRAYDLGIGQGDDWLLSRDLLRLR